MENVERSSKTGKKKPLEKLVARSQGEKIRGTKRRNSPRLKKVIKNKEGKEAKHGLNQQKNKKDQHSKTIAMNLENAPQENNTKQPPVRPTRQKTNNEVASSQESETKTNKRTKFVKRTKVASQDNSIEENIGKENKPESRLESPPKFEFKATSSFSKRKQEQLKLLQEADIAKLKTLANFFKSLDEEELFFE